MQALKQAPRDFFEEFGLEVTSGEVSLGETYPIFGMITRILDTTSGHITVEINFHITARMKISDPEGVETLRERLFETGIFVATVIAKEPSVEVVCRTVIFGRRQGLNA